MIDISQSRLRIATFILILFYAVGIIGIWLRPAYFTPLTSINLLLTCALLFWLHAQKDAFFYFTLSLIFVSAFILEWMGVNSGLIFGRYYYGNALGLKIGSTPLIIGLNWVIVCYASIHFADKLARMMKLKLNELTGALATALLMVLLDLLIEPLAPRLDLWYWEGGQAPFQNFTAWFFFGFAFSYWLLKSGIALKNPMGWRVYLVQFAFFAALHFLL